MKKTLLFVIAVLLICSTVIGASADGVLRYAVNDLVHLDPNSVAADAEFHPLVYDTLFELNPEWEPVGVIVESWEISEDGKDHTWHILEGVTFSDGSPLTAETVKWNLDRKFDNALPYTENIPWESCEVVDDTTLIVHLTEHYLPMYHYLSSQSFSVYNPAFVEEVGDEGLKNDVLGSGMYIIEEYRPNDFVRLIPNPNYRDPEAIHFDAVEFYIIKDPNTRLMMLEAGEVDIIKEVSLFDLDYLDGVEGVKTMVEPGSRNYHVTMHTQRPPLDNPEVRRAFNYAVDKEGMNNSIFDGRYNYMLDINTVTPFVTGYSAQEPYEYNPEKAMELLEANGLVDTNGDGFREWEGAEKEFVFVTRKGQRVGDIEIAEQVAAMLGEVGINVRIDVMDSATYFTYLNVPFEENTLYYDLSNQAPANFTGDKEYGASSFFLCNGWPGTAYNYSHYCSEEFQSLYEESLKVTDMDERNELLAKASNVAWTDAPEIFLFDGINTAACANNLQGVYSDGAHMIWQLKYAYFE